MPRQLPADCLNTTFEYLEKADLRSCLLVSRLWCEVSVPILWTSIQNYNTLIACLPIESKEILFKNEIIISTPTSKSPLFNYATFIKNLSLCKMCRNIKNILTSFDSNEYIIVVQEVFKMFMNQTCLKNLKIINSWFDSNYVPILPFSTYPGAIGCLKNLLELNCSSDISSEFFNQLSQMCYNIQSLKIYFRREISNGLLNLIAVQ